MVRGLAIVAMLCACNAKLGEKVANSESDANAGNGDGGGGGDDGAGGSADAMIPLGPWSTPTAIPGASSTTNSEDDCTLSANTLDMIFAIQVPMGTKQLYEMQRPSTTEPWGTAQKLTALDVAASDQEGPRLSLNDLTLYFGRDGTIYQSTRQAIGGTWSAPTTVDAMNTGAYAKWMAICQGDRVMISRDAGATGQDLFEGTLTGGASTADDVLNSADSEISTFLSTDCLTVYFASNRSGSTQIYTSTRPTPDGAWAAPTLAASPFSPADGTDNEDAWISIDTRTFVFASVRGAATTKDIYISTR